MEPGEWPGAKDYYYQTYHYIEDSLSLTGNVKNLQVSVPQPEHVALFKTRDMG